jgi:hypothetical protein
MSGEGPDVAVGSAEWPAAAPDRRTWAAALWRDRGGRRGAVDSVREADGQDRAIAGPGGQWWVREGEEGMRQRRHRALTGGAGQHSAARGLTRFKLNSEVK